MSESFRDSNHAGKDQKEEGGLLPSTTLTAEQEAARQEKLKITHEEFLKEMATRAHVHKTQSSIAGASVITLRNYREEKEKELLRQKQMDQDAMKQLEEIKYQEKKKEKQSELKVREEKNKKKRNRRKNKQGGGKEEMTSAEEVGDRSSSDEGKEPAAKRQRIE